MDSSYQLCGGGVKVERHLSDMSKRIMRNLMAVYEMVSKSLFQGQKKCSPCVFFVADLCFIKDITGKWKFYGTSSFGFKLTSIHFLDEI